jgi:uncharacterized protein (TIGR03435 family)
MDIVLAAFLVLGLASASPGRYQSPPQTASASAHVYVYEVSSVKLYKSGNGDVGIHYTPDGLTATNVGLLSLLRLAFGVHDDQIIGLPKSIGSETYELQATMDESLADALKKLSPQEVQRARQQMLQSLLIDRFKLTIHHDTKALPVFSLVIANSGFKLREAAPDEVDSQGRSGTYLSGSSGAMRGQLVSMTFLAQFLSRTLDRTVLDKTGLTGKYDFLLKWTTNQNQLQTPAGFEATSAAAPNGAPAIPSSDTSAPDLFTAVQEQLGLKLKAEKAPVDVIVIDHVARPSGN